MNKQEAIEKTYTASWDDLNYKGLIIDVETVNKIIYQIAEPKKVVVPKFVGEWLEWCKTNDVTLLGAISPIDELGSAICNDKRVESLAASRWAIRNQDTFARAWLDGYAVEKEKLYTVEVEGAILTKITRGRNIQYKMLPSEDVSAFFDKAIYTTKLTEQEIKQKDERLWQVAKEVE